MDCDIRTTQPPGGSMLSSTSLRGTTPSTPSTSGEKHATSTSQFKATGMSKAWLSCVTFNPRSGCNKLSLLHCFIYNKNYDLIFITESWLNDTVTNDLIDPQCHYHIVRRDRDGRGGDVCILLLRSFDYIVYDSDLFSDLELLCVDVVICSEQFRFLVIYRPPGHSSVDKLCKALVSVFDCKHSVFVVGDLNCPSINWENVFAPTMVFKTHYWIYS